MPVGGTRGTHQRRSAFVPTTCPIGSGFDGHEWARRAPRLQSEIDVAATVVEAAQRDLARARLAVDRTATRLVDLTKQRKEAAAAIERRDAWLRDHPEVVAWEQAVGERIRARTRTLGEQAATAEPSHLRRVLGPVPLLPSLRDGWITAAGEIEAYRERWDVSAEARS